MAWRMGNPQEHFRVFLSSSELPGIFSLTQLLSIHNLILFYFRCVAHNFTECSLMDSTSRPLYLDSFVLSIALAKCFAPNRYTLGSTVIVVELYQVNYPSQQNRINLRPPEVNVPSRRWPCRLAHPNNREQFEDTVFEFFMCAEPHSILTSNRVDQHGESLPKVC